MCVVPTASWCVFGMALGVAYKGLLLWNGFRGCSQRPAALLWLALLGPLCCFERDWARHRGTCDTRSTLLACRCCCNAVVCFAKPLHCGLKLWRAQGVYGVAVMLIPSSLSRISALVQAVTQSHAGAGRRAHETALTDAAVGTRRAGTWS